MDVGINEHRNLGAKGYVRNEIYAHIYNSEFLSLIFICFLKKYLLDPAKIKI